jgi:hypothetical protein
MSGTINKAYQEGMKKIQDKIENACKAKGHEKIDVRYAACEFDEWDIPIDNLNDIPLEGKVKFNDQGDFFDFRGDESIYEAFESEVIDSPTWLDIAVVANAMIQKTNDRHHKYLEMITDIHDEDGVMIATLNMGS